MQLNTADEGTGCLICSKCGESCDPHADKVDAATPKAKPSADWEKNIDRQASYDCFSRSTGEDLKQLIRQLLTTQRTAYREEIKKRIEVEEKVSGVDEYHGLELARTIIEDVLK